MTINMINISKGKGLPSDPYQTVSQAHVNSSELTAFVRDHIQQLAAQSTWEAMQIIDMQFHNKGLFEQLSVEINYEQREQDGREYYSAIIWYDFTGCIHMYKNTPEKYH